MEYMEPEIVLAAKRARLNFVKKNIVKKMVGLLMLKNYLQNK